MRVLFSVHAVTYRVEAACRQVCLETSTWRRDIPVKQNTSIYFITSCFAILPFLFLGTPFLPVFLLSLLPFYVKLPWIFYWRVKLFLSRTTTSDAGSRIVWTEFLLRHRTTEQLLLLPIPTLIIGI
jgi:hypothetical protein